MTMYPNNSEENIMFMLTWPDVRTFNTGIYAEDEILLNKQEQIKFSSRLALADAPGRVWSASEERALAVARRIRTGTINVNGGIFYGADAPFGGYKQSGLGREMGPEGFEEYLETKTLAIGI